MDTAGIFAEIFKDYKKPEKDIVGKLSDLWGEYTNWAEGGNDPETKKAVEAFNKYSGFGPGMLGGPTFVKKAIQSGRFPESIFDYSKDLLKQIKSGNLKLNDPINNVPGALNPDFFNSPIIEAINRNTGIVPMPYTKGKTLVTMGEMGSPKLRVESLSKKDVQQALKETGLPIKDIAIWDDLERYYPQIWNNLEVKVGNMGVPPTSKYSASMHYRDKTGGGYMLLDNPAILEAESLPQLQRLINHEGQHAISTHEGLSMGGAPSEFGFVKPQGFETSTPLQIYKMLLDERLAQVAERPSGWWDTAKRLYRKANGFPLLHKEALVGPEGKRSWVREGKDYGSDGYHYGKTWEEYIKELTKPFWE